MQISIVNQFAGTNTVQTSVDALLEDATVKRLRVLMAFCRGSGVGLLRDSLRNFIDRGGTVDAVIGLDLGGTSPEALESLVELGVQVHVFGVKGDRTFHPKVCIFDDPKGSRFSTLIGSSNWTAGGLDSNFETAVRLDLNSPTGADQTARHEVEQLWATYRTPVVPMGSTNLKRVDKRRARRWASKLAREPAPPPDDGRNKLADRLFGSIKAPRQPFRRAGRGKTTATLPSPPVVGLPKTLYLEVTGAETGQGREIQVPVDTLPEYFGIDRDDVYYMTYLHEDNSREENRPLAVYDVNTTFRISSGHFKSISLAERPMIVRLDRQSDPDTFRVRIIRNSTAAYATAEKRLTRGGVNGKRWGLS